MSNTVWSKETVHEIVEKQRAFFLSGKTLDINFREEMLKKLEEGLKAASNEFADALTKDLGRTSFESLLTEIGPTIGQIKDTRKHVKKWNKPELHLSGISCFPSIFTRVYKAPYGVTLIISPFNFPLYLSLVVVAAAIGGGNTVVLKTSSKTDATTEVLKKLLSELYPSEYVTVIDGGHDVADMCLEERFDKIFYTGSPRVAKHIMEMASKNLTPVALELGGETGNWCVIRKDADFRDAARKIAFFKLLNSGQICVNINQVAVAKEIADDFVEELKKAFRSQIGEKAADNPEYPHLISESAYDKCAEEAALYKDRIVYGGTGNRENLKYEPTIIYPVSCDEPIVKHELFCPLLPIVTYEDEKIDELLDTIAKREHGLAFYVFSKDKKWAKRVMQSQQFGGGCINEVFVHLAVPGVPFNGTGHSGMGSYHGVWGFREFTHPVTVLFGKNRLNLSVREHPYTGPEGEKKKKMLNLL